MNKVIVVDDDEAIHTIVQSILEHDYQVHHTQGGEECIELLTESDNYHVILLDINMPGTNGWETLRILKDPDNWPHIPVIMFTAMNEPENALKAWCIGAEFYMTKPFSATVLLETVRMALKPKEEVSADG